MLRQDQWLMRHKTASQVWWSRLDLYCSCCWSEQSITSRPDSITCWKPRLQKVENYFKKRFKKIIYIYMCIYLFYVPDSQRLAFFWCYPPSKKKTTEEKSLISPVFTASCKNSCFAGPRQKTRRRSQGTGPEHSRGVVQHSAEASELTMGWYPELKNRERKIHTRTEASC